MRSPPAVHLTLQVRSSVGTGFYGVMFVGGKVPGDYQQRYLAGWQECVSSRGL